MKFLSRRVSESVEPNISCGRSDKKVFKRNLIKLQYSALAIERFRVDSGNGQKIDLRLLKRLPDLKKAHNGRIRFPGKLPPPMNPLVL